MHRRIRLGLLLASIALLAACATARRVSEPAVSIQQLTVRADGNWEVDLRLQNYSSVPMRFGQVSLDVTVADQAAGQLQHNVDFSIGPETADVVSIVMQPTSPARIVLADVLAGGRALPYQLKGTVTATPEDKKARQFDVQGRSTLNPAPGLNGVLR